MPSALKENTVSFLKLQSMEIKIICPLHLPRVTLVNAISLITTGKDSTTAFCAGFHCDLVTGVWVRQSQWCSLQWHCQQPPPTPWSMAPPPIHHCCHSLSLSIRGCQPQSLNMEQTFNRLSSMNFITIWVLNSHKCQFVCWFFYHSRCIWTDCCVKEEQEVFPTDNMGCNLPIPACLIIKTSMKTQYIRCLFNSFLPFK